MYVPEHFAVDDDVVRDFLDDIRAADLVTETDDGLVATYLPLLHQPDGGPQGSLVGHVARNNDQWRRQPHGQALVIARGPDAYISPSSYPSKAEHGRVVPTWNYVTVHAYGRLVVHDDPVWVEALVRRLTDHHERGRDQPWSVDDASARYYAGQLRAIVGVELVIERLEAKFKLSQNRPAGDIDGVVAQLAADGDGKSAGLVERFRPELPD